MFAALSKYLDSELPARNCRQLEQHLRGCKRCVEYLETLKKTIRACRLYQATPAPPPSPAVREAIVKALSRKPLSHSSGRRT